MLYLSARKVYVAMMYGALNDAPGVACFRNAPAHMWA
jgi:hypothetical protein